MALMGYEEGDINQFIDYISLAMDYVKDANDEQLWKNLIKVVDFLDGMLVEGRI
jgi:hypothetical protein